MTDETKHAKVGFEIVAFAQLPVGRGVDAKVLERRQLDSEGAESSNPAGLGWPRTILERRAADSRSSLVIGRQPNRRHVSDTEVAAAGTYWNERSRMERAGFIACLSRSAATSAR